MKFGGVAANFLQQVGSLPLPLSHPHVKCKKTHATAKALHCFSAVALPPLCLFPRLFPRLFQPIGSCPHQWKPFTFHFVAVFQTKSRIQRGWNHIGGFSLSHFVPSVVARESCGKSAKLRVLQPPRRRVTAALGGFGGVGGVGGLSMHCHG